MPRSATTAKVIPLPRKASREIRRQQLIDATIETLARKGYAALTLTDVAVEAGLSHGLVNFHFQSKEKLLSETLQHLAAEYQQNWQHYLGRAAPSPAARIDALIRADLDQKVCTKAKLRCWTAFWGESQSRPIYQKEYGGNDEAYNALLTEICAELIATAGYALAPLQVSRLIRAIGDGVWQDLAFSEAPYSRREALQTLHLGLSSLFPRHFSIKGLI